MLFVIYIKKILKLLINRCTHSRKPTWPFIKRKGTLIDIQTLIPRSCSECSYTLLIYFTLVMVADAVIPVPVLAMQYYGGPVVTILSSKQSSIYIYIYSKLLNWLVGTDKPMHLRYQNSLRINYIKFLKMSRCGKNPVSCVDPILDRIG